MSYFYRFCEGIESICSWKFLYKPISKQLVKKKKLYYSNLDSNNDYKLYHFVCLTFKHTKHINSLKYKLKEQDDKLNVVGIGEIDIKLHEYTAKPYITIDFKT